MAKTKRSDKLIALKCSACSRRTYYVAKNKKSVERKIELVKYCKWCRKRTKHKEGRITGK